MVRLDAALKALFDRVAKQERRAASDIVRQLIIEFLRGKGHEIPEPPPDNEDDQ